MSKTSNPSNFLNKVQTFITDEISNEQFGVSELSDAMNMSRSSLLRNIKKQTGLSASQFIRKIRLEKAMELLQDSELTISEISFEVGFSNTSYFIKCYREEFGHPPGEARKQLIEESKHQLNFDAPEASTLDSQKTFKQKKLNTYIIVFAIALIAVISFYWGRQDANTFDGIEAKSIAVLPFKNMSTDSTNYYFVNGLMEASLYNLQKIQDLRVVSRTSVEKYRKERMSASKIAEELNVAFLVEGSGQKNEDQILLNIQLIDVQSDSPIWTEQYQYKLEDVFTLQNTIAKQIALAVEANITPQELVQIDKKPTEDIEAYDAYLKGVELIWKRDSLSLQKAISYFDEAINKDPKYSNAYAQKAMAYYFIDEYKYEKPNLAKLNKNADKALLYDTKSDLSLIAKALYYIATKEFNLAIPHLEKALEYNPNSSSVILILSEMYARVLPDTKKYLTYALKGIQLEKNNQDSIAQSYIYLHLSNALVQAGFVKESLVYINNSLSYYSENEYAPYLKGFINYAINMNKNELLTTLEKEWKRDSTRVDITQELGKFYYYLEEYEKSYHYYEKYQTLQVGKADLYPFENLKIGIVYDKMGYPKKAAEFYKKYRNHCLVDQTTYQPASLAMQYIFDGKYDEAIAQFQKFSNESNFHYWMILFLEDDPLLQKLKSHKDYKATMQKIQDQFWKQHELVKNLLKNKGLL